MSAIGAVRIVDAGNPHFGEVARHEAAHAAAAGLRGWDDITIEIRPDGGGHCDFTPPHGVGRARELEDRIIVLLAAVAYTGDKGGGADMRDALEATRELAELRGFPVDWLFARLERHAQQLVESRPFKWAVTYLALGLERGRLGPADVAELLERAARDCAEGRMRLHDGGVRS